MCESYTSKVIKELATLKDYIFVDFSINVDGSHCLLVQRTEHQYFEKKIYREDKKDPKEMALSIYNQVEAYWTGWGFKKGLRNTK